jgi:hypothetical protein
MSMGYLVMILVYVLFFHPEEDGRTSLLSMHRYVFCSPFFYFLLLKNMNRYSVNRFTLRILLAALLITLLAIGFPTSELLNWSYTIVLFYVAVILFFVVQSLVLLRSAWSLPVIMMISLVNLLLQIYLFHSFLNGNWVG